MAMVFGIARSRVVDAYRAVGRDRCQPTAAVPDAIDASAGPELLAMRTVQVERLRSALEQLPEHHREVIVLRVALRYSAEEVARIQQTTPGAIRVAQFRAMKRLRGLLLDHDDAAVSPK